jgi:hypothetical protein
MELRESLYKDAFKFCVKHVPKCSVLKVTDVAVARNFEIRSDEIFKAQWLLYVPPALTLNRSAFFLKNVFICSVRSS